MAGRAPSSPGERATVPEEAAGVRETGLGKATVPTKDLLLGAYLGRLASEILAAVDRRAADADSAGAALHGLLDSIKADLRRDGFRGCAFNNASVEFDDPAHPARVAAREYRRDLHERFRAGARRLLPDRDEEATRLAGRLAALVDGAYTSLSPAHPRSCS